MKRDKMYIHVFCGCFRKKDFHKGWLFEKLDFKKSLTNFLNTVSKDVTINHYEASIMMGKDFDYDTK